MADDTEAFLELNDAELAALRPVGERVPVSAGQYLYREGDPAYDFYVVLAGVVEIVVTADGAERVLARHAAGRFLGELNLLTGQRVFVSARVAEPGEVLAVPRDALRRLIATNAGLSDKVLAAFLARRGLLMTGASSAIRGIGSRFSADSGRIREFLVRNRIPHEWLDPDGDRDVERLLRELDIAARDLPVVIVSSKVLRHPTSGELAEYLGLTVGAMPDGGFDLIVVGAGPAGLAAAVYGASEGLRTLVLEMVAIGGQAGSSSRIENYLGFPTGISGSDLTQRATVQAQKFGASFSSPCTVGGLQDDSGHFLLRLSNGTEIPGRAVIVATGARYRRLDAVGLERFETRGVYYAATELEARACAGSPAVIAGGGNSAGQAALFLVNAGTAVTIVIRGPDLAATMSRYLIDRIEADTRIVVRRNTSIVGLEGDDFLSAVRIDGPTGEERLATTALFSFIGADPASQWLSGSAALDDRGFVLTDRSLGREQLNGAWKTLGRAPLPFETSRPGLFAVGDVRSGSTKRVAAAVGEGSAAVRSVHEYLTFDRH
ncbi:MAG TPA: FAD-dependent oxidoreductase [Vicinamibacterales bacterium]|nr:FAD-dependent oxidoreductase [Vicinamibacterales bacterium]